NPVDRVDIEAAKAHLVEIRNQPELHAVASTMIDDAHDGFVRRAWQGDNDLRDAVLVDDAFKLVGRAEATEPTEVGLAVGSQKANDLIAQMRPPGERLHDHAADSVVADDKRADDAQAMLMEYAQHPQADPSAEEDQQRDQSPREDQRQARFGGIANEGRSGEQQ